MGEKKQRNFYSNDDLIEDVEQIADERHNGNRSKAITEALEDYREEHGDLLDAE